MANADNKLIDERASKGAMPMKVALRGPISAIILSGVVAGTLNLVGAAMIFGGPPAHGFQLIASGLLGDWAFSGGSNTVALGAALHYAITMFAAAIFWLLAARWKMLSDRWLVSGLVFGVLAYVIMNLIIVPLSKATGPELSPVIVLEDLAAHILLFGIPIASIVRIARGARRRAAPSAIDVTGETGRKARSWLNRG